MDSGAVITQLEALLAEQMQAGESLLASLAAESAALGARDAAALAGASDSKTRALSELETLEARRRELATRIGAGPGPAEMDAWITAFAAGSPHQAQGLGARWRALTDLLRRCRGANQANGLVVASLQRRVQQALGVLRGTGAEPAVYGPTGTSMPRSGARALARA